jgi:lysozyme
MAINMEFSDSGVEKLKKLEGYSAIPYRDSAGKLTIGYGHLMRSGDKLLTTDTLDEDDAEALLLKDIAPAVSAVNQGVTSTINQNQFDALVLFTYNIGVGNFLASTLLRCVNAGNLVGASLEFMKWDKIHTAQGAYIEVAGLKNRRLAEQELFNEAG